MSIKATNLLRGIPASLPDELTEVLVECDSLRIERIVSRGHSSPPDFWYDQDENEWVLVISGRARLEFAGDGRMVDLGKHYGPHTDPVSCRCDLHPRWSRGGGFVSFDSLHEGARRVYLADVSGVTCA